jgi:3-dehydroquinate synthase
MEDSLVHDYDISSLSKTYTVNFDDTLLSKDIAAMGTHFIIDKNVMEHLGLEFYNAAQSKAVYLLDATEENKSYDRIGQVIEYFLTNNLRRDSHLVAIGGGITQDIACFIASTFMRGIDWTFLPTTLLAQADSCIGSKSSINFGPYKNLLGTYNPPNQIYISNEFLHTLTPQDFLSGVGEIVKLFILNHQAVDVTAVTVDTVSEYVYRAQQIKKTYIEFDEFDRGPRNLLNYGHCIGHAIESATNFGIPHGIAIAKGMDIANRFALQQELITQEQYDTMHSTIYPCYAAFDSYPINMDAIIPALSKDKKNTGNMFNLILPVHTQFEKRGFVKSPELTDNILRCF